MKKDIADIVAQKKRQEKIVMLTAYDYPTAKLLDQSGVDVVLVGDSLANVILGLESTKDVGLEEMIYHAKAVRRGVLEAVLIGDMPYAAYQPDPSTAVDNARRLVTEAGCDGVKVEWFADCVAVAARLVAAGIPVMGHVGLTPQRAEELGGFKVQGRDADSAYQLLEQARQLEAAGCFSLVLECIPKEVAQLITDRLSIPTIGIGAGIHCDGQVLVLHDLLGFGGRHRPKFVKKYADLPAVMTTAIGAYRKDVLKGRFPRQDHSFALAPEVLGTLKKRLQH